VPLVRQADNADGVKPIRDGCQWPDHQPLARKTADAVMEQKRVLLPIHLHKKGAQGINIRLTIETLHRGPPMAWLPLRPHTGLDHGKKREQTLRKDGDGRREVVMGAYPTSSSSAWCSQCTSSGWRVAQSSAGISLPFSGTWRCGLLPARIASGKRQRVQKACRRGLAWCNQHTAIVRLLDIVLVYTNILPLCPDTRSRSSSQQNPCNSPLSRLVPSPYSCAISALILRAESCVNGHAVAMIAHKDSVCS
jgi:hypothetical protein